MQRTGLDGSGEGYARLAKNERRKQNRVNLGTAHHHPALAGKYFDTLLIAVPRPVNKFPCVRPSMQDL
jgi:hypothetical protein